MAADLIVRLLADDEDECAWCDADGATSGRGTLAAAGDAASGRRVHVIVPGTAVLVTRVAVPASQRGRALAAVPWALEDRLADDVESLHFVLGHQHPGGEWSVAIAARAAMDDWLARCTRAGIQPASMRPETLALPAPAATEWVVLEEPGRVIVRTADDAGFACEPEMLELLAGAREAPERIRRIGGDLATWPSPLADRVAPAEPAVDAAVDAVTAFAHPTGGIDLLQGPYSRRERAGRQLRRWRVPAGLAAILLIALAGHLAYDYAALGEREAELRARMQALFQQAFPDVQNVRDPRAQMAARLRSLQGEGGSGPEFAELLARTGGVLSGESGARLTGLTWRAGTLELEVAAEDLQALDRVQRGLTEAGLAAELRGADRGEDRIDGRITVREGGA